MKCTKCGCTSATSSVHIWKKPKILAIVLGRNIDVNNKNNKFISIPSSLNISKFSIFDQKREYMIHGVLSHHGRSANHGHCTYSYYFNNKWWYTFDDNNICESDDINYKDAYIIVYK